MIYGVYGTVPAKPLPLVSILSAIGSSFDMWCVIKVIVCIWLYIYYNFLFIVWGVYIQLRSTSYSIALAYCSNKVGKNKPSFNKVFAYTNLGSSILGINVWPLGYLSVSLSYQWMAPKL